MSNDFFTITCATPKHKDVTYNIPGIANPPLKDIWFIPSRGEFLFITPKYQQLSSTGKCEDNTPYLIDKAFADIGAQTDLTETQKSEKANKLFFKGNPTGNNANEGQHAKDSNPSVTDPRFVECISMETSEEMLIAQELIDQVKNESKGKYFVKLLEPATKKGEDIFKDHREPSAAPVKEGEDDQQNCIY